MKYKRLLIIIALIMFITLSFFLQMEFYTSRIGDFYGLFFLILLELVKLICELTIFVEIIYKSGYRKYSSKLLIISLVVSVALMSIYATKETIKNLNQQSVHIKIQRSHKIDKGILNNQLKLLEEQLRSNIGSLKKYNENPRLYWQVSIKKIRKQNIELNKKISKINNQLLIFSKDNQNNNNITFLKMNPFIIIFLSVFLEFGIIFLCWLTIKITIITGQVTQVTGQVTQVTNEVTDQVTDQVTGQQVSEFIIHSKSTQQKFADIFGVSRQYVNKMIKGKSPIPPEIVKYIIQAKNGGNK